MKPILYVGVDGGGTKTEVVIQNEAGQMLGTGRGGPGNIKTSLPVSIASFKRAFDQAWVQAKLSASEDYRIMAGFGMAGSEIREAKAEFVKAIEPYGFLHTVVASDAHIACLGAHGGKDGAIIIIGTGVHGRLISGAMEKRVGGWGFPHSDEGGGAWLGLQAIGLAFQGLDGRIDDTDFLKAIRNRFQDEEDMVYFANKAQPADFATLSPLVFSWRERDPLALRLVQSAARHISLVWQALVKEMTSPLPLVLLGGLAPVLQPYLDGSVKNLTVMPKAGAPEGAILMLHKYGARPCLS